MPGRLTRVIAVAVALAIVVGTGVAWGKIRSFESGINHISPLALGEGGEDGAIDILLVGMDSRTDAHGNPLSAEELATLRAGDDVSTNTDTIILVRIPNNGTSATAISIPRDSYVDAPGVGKTKINGVFGSVKLEKMKELVEQQGEDPAQAEPQAAEAGREALIKTVANLTGVTVDHYAEIGLLGFALITDALGGVDVCLKDAVYEPLSGADFPAGWQKLDGPQALSFVRQRHDLPRGDLDRVTRQQAVMASLAHQVISGKTLSSPSTLNRLQDAVQRSVVLSDGWDIMDFVQQLQKLAAGNVAFATIPVLEEDGWSDDGMQSVVRVDPSQVKEWVAGLLQDQDEGKTEEIAYSPSKTTTDVVNDSDINGLAASVSEVLTGKGFTTGSIGNNEAEHVTSSQVQAAKTDDLGAQAVSKELGDLPVVENASVSPGSVRVVLAGDYTGPGSGLARQRSDTGHRRPCGRGNDRLRARTIADPHGRLERPGVRELTTLTSALLDPLLAADPVGPRITYYDDATGERIELSTVTLANWAAKTGNLLRDELGAGPASRVACCCPRTGRPPPCCSESGGSARKSCCPGYKKSEPTSPCALPTGSTRPTLPSARARSRCCRWTRSASRSPTCRSASPTTPRRCGCTATRSPPNATRARAGRPVGRRGPRRGTEPRRPHRVARRRPGAVDRPAGTPPTTLIDNLLAVFVAGASLVQVANPDAAALDRRRQTEKVTAG